MSETDEIIDLEKSSDSEEEVKPKKPKRERTEKQKEHFARLSEQNKKRFEEKRLKKEEEEKQRKEELEKKVIEKAIKLKKKQIKKERILEELSESDTEIEKPKRPSSTVRPKVEPKIFQPPLPPPYVRKYNYM